MFKKYLIVILSFLVIFSTIIKADVPPEPGSLRVYPELVFESQEDFPDYRFFLKSLIDLEEIQLKKGETKTIDNTNRGGAKRAATLIAIPRSELEKFAVSQSDKGEKYNSTEEIKKLLDGKQINGAVELIQHSFQKDITISERANWTYPTYRIERDGTSLKAVKSGEISQKMSIEEEKLLNAGKFKIVMIIAGLMTTLTIIVLGIVVIRKVLKKG